MQDALKKTQPALLEHCHSLPENLEWIYGRDGYLTAHERGRWWSGCSLPIRAARHASNDGGAGERRLLSQPRGTLHKCGSCLRCSNAGRE